MRYWLCGRVPDFQSGGCGFESQPGLLRTRDVPEFQFLLAGYPAVFFYPVPAPVPAEMVPGTGYLYRIVLGRFRQLVDAADRQCHVDQVFLPLLVVELCSVCEKQTQGIIHFYS